MPEPDVLVAGLDGGLPVALLPVRLEARYFDDGRELRVRIYPDQIHVDAHERELTAAERDAGEAYWRSRLAGGSDAWPALCGAVRGAPRAAWVAHALTPTNLGQPGDPAFPSVDERPTVWSRPAVAKALPQQWVLVGTRAGTELFRVWTKSTFCSSSCWTSSKPELMLRDQAVSTSRHRASVSIGKFPN